MISYHSLDDGRSDRIMAVDCHPDMSESVVTFATVGGGGGEGDVRIWCVSRESSTAGEVVAAGDPSSVEMLGTSPGARARKDVPKYCASLRKGHDGAVNCARWAPDGSMIASAGDRGTVCVWTGESQAAWWRGLDEEGCEARANCSHLAHADDVYDVAWSPCGGYLLTGAIDHSANLWHVATKRRVRTMTDHGHYVQGVAFDPRGECFATQSSDKTVRLYVLPTNWETRKKGLVGKVLKLWPNPVDAKVARKRQREIDNHDEENGLASQLRLSPVFANELQFAGFFRRLAFSTDGEALVVPAALARPDIAGKRAAMGAVAYARGKLGDGPCVYFPAGDGGSASVAKACPVLFDQGRRSVFALALTDSVVVYDIRNPQPLVVCKGLHRAPLTDLAWARDGSILIVASGDGYLSYLRFSIDDLGRPEPAPPLASNQATHTAPIESRPPTPQKQARSPVNLLIPRKKSKGLDTFDAAIGRDNGQPRLSATKKKIVPTLISGPPTA